VVAAVLLWSAGLAEAQRPIAGSKTVGEWRRMVREYGTWADAYATAWGGGAMTWQNIVVWCENPTTVGELVAYLRYGADPSWTLRQALVIGAHRRGCDFMPMEEIQRAIQAGRD
jgi:hypothetical protein